jgi:hypothetical protein
MENMQEISSAASQVLISVIPIIGIGVGGIVVFFYLLWDHKRRMLLIKNGQYRPVFDLESFSLLAGLLLGFVGLALTIFLAIVTDGNKYTLLGGIIPLSIGVGLLSYYLIKRFGRG